MKKRITKYLITALLFLTIIPIQNLDARYYADRHVGNVGHICGFVLHASGYSEPNWGEVTATWRQSWWMFPHSLSNQITYSVQNINSAYAYGVYWHHTGFPVGSQRKMLKLVF